MNVEFYGKTILVTGASGSLARSLTSKLVREGWTVRTLAQDSTQARHLAGEGVDVIQGEISDAALLQKIVPGCHIVFHLPRPEDEPPTYSPDRSAIVHGTRTLAEASRKAGVERFVLVSSLMVYGLKTGTDTTEAYPLEKSGIAYFDAVMQAEQVVRKMASTGELPAVIVQPGIIYGPGADAWTLQPVRFMQAGKLYLPNKGLGLVQPLYIEDAVDGIIAGASVGKTGAAYILCGSQVVTFYEFFEHYARMLGMSTVPLATTGLLSLFGDKPSTFPDWQVRCMSMKASYNGGKAYYELGFLPRFDLNAGMRQTEAWLRSGGILPRKSQHPAVPETG